MKYITTGRPDYDAVRSMINKLSKKYPYLKVFSIGKSWLGRNIQAISIGNASDTVLFAGGFHGSEWLTILVLLRFMERLCLAYSDETEISGVNICEAMYGRQITFIPCINPDGTEIALFGPGAALWNAGRVMRISKDYKHWQANARGVDINHNFDAGWNELHKLERQSGILGPARTQYGGVMAESEPETRAITSFCRKNVVRHAIAMHSQGEVIYWKYGNNTPVKSQTMAGIMSASSGYELSSPEGMASHGGFKDWFISTFSRPAFTVEIGKGENPLPLDMFDDIYNKIEEMMLFASLF